MFCSLPLQISSFALSHRIFLCRCQKFLYATVKRFLLPCRAWMLTRFYRSAFSLWNKINCIIWRLLVYSPSCSGASWAPKNSCRWSVTYGTWLPKSTWRTSYTRRVAGGLLSSLQCGSLHQTLFFTLALDGDRYVLLFLSAHFLFSSDCSLFSERLFVSGSAAFFLLRLQILAL